MGAKFPSSDGKIESTQKKLVYLNIARKNYQKIILIIITIK